MAKSLPFVHLRESKNKFRLPNKLSQSFVVCIGTDLLCCEMRAYLDELLAFMQTPMQPFYGQLQANARINHREAAPSLLPTSTSTTNNGRSRWAQPLKLRSDRKTPWSQPTSASRRLLQATMAPLLRALSLRHLLMALTIWSILFTVFTC